MSSPKPISILLVEDNPGHAALFTKMLRHQNFQNDFTYLSCGRKAIDYFLEGQLDSTQLLLLDLNLPLIHGTDVLQEIRKSYSADQVPVIILSSTTDETEIDRCYELGAQGYIGKPVFPSTFLSAVLDLGDDYLDTHNESGARLLCREG